MANLARKEFADRRGVNPGTVTKWDRRGLLVLTPDGKVDVEKTEWNLDQQPAKYRGGTTHRPVRTVPQYGAQNRARAQPAPLPPPTVEHEAARTALALAFPLHARIVAASVLEAGGSIEVAYAAAYIAHSTTFDAYGLVLSYLGHPDAGDEDPSLPLHGTPTAEPDWHALAAAGGLTFDPAICARHLDARPISGASDAPPVFEVPFTLADLITDHL